MHGNHRPPGKPHLLSKRISAPCPAVVRSAGAATRSLRCSGSTALSVATILATLLALAFAGHAEAAWPDAVANSVQTTDPFEPFVAEAAARFNVPASWLRAVMRVESGGDAQAVSAKGAMGLMQIMPETWIGLRSQIGLGSDPFDLHDNILAGAAYLRALHDLYGAAGFLAAYNAGPARYEDHLATGRLLPAETRAFMATLAPVIIGGTADGNSIAVVSGHYGADSPLFFGDTLDKLAAPRHGSGLQVDGHSISTAGQHPTALTPLSGGLFVSLVRRDAQP